MMAGETTTFVMDGVTVTTGAAGSRCFRDLEAQLGEAEANAIVRTAYREKMTIVRRRWPDARGLERFHVVVEALLLAACASDLQAESLAAHYRSGRDASANVIRFSRR